MITLQIAPPLSVAVVAVSMVSFVTAAQQPQAVLASWKIPQLMEACSWGNHFFGGGIVQLATFDYRR
jgi:hypothetical protein